MESRPCNLFNPEHLHLSRHLRIHPGTTSPPSSQCSAKSYNTWPALPQRKPTHAPGLEASAAASSSSDLAAGGRLNQAPQSQLQRRQDPLAVPVSRLLSRPPKILRDQHHPIHQPSFNRRVPSISKPQNSLKPSHN
ncbi:hypothetical protein MRX96_057826 [Rhipicephalus microplus]